MDDTNEAMKEWDELQKYSDDAFNPQQTEEQSNE